MTRIEDPSALDDLFTHQFTGAEWSEEFEAITLNFGSHQLFICMEVDEDEENFLSLFRVDKAIN